MAVRGLRAMFGVLSTTVAVAVAAQPATAGLPASSAAAGTAPPAGRYDHVFVVVEENHGFADVIGNPAAPNLNRLAAQYGLATDYSGVTHPSEPNYVALLGGSTFGVTNDNPYYLNRVNKPSLISQLDQAHVSWKAYLQGLPHAGYQGICYPAYCNGTPDKDPLYVSKHNPVTNFTTSWNRRDWSRQVPGTQLTRDLRADTVPAFSLVIPDECHDQHGDPPYCVDSGSAGDRQDQHLLATGDRYLGNTVAAITGSPMWARGNNAVVVVYDEGESGSAPGGGKVAAVVVTSHGPRHVRDATAYNHYSLLKTIQRNFGLGCLAHSCDTAVAPMTPLFTVTGAPAAATSPQQVPPFPTPTPTPRPSEPVSTSTNHDSRGGWTVQPAPQRGTGDNSFGAISATSPQNVWAVGNYLPDTKTSNPDATLSLAAHYNGHRWTSTPTPNTGTNFTTLFGVAAAGRQAWAVGDALDANHAARSVIEHWDGARWRLAPAPTLSGQRDMLFAAAATSAHDVWAVGQQQNTAGTFTTLIEHYNGRRWTQVPSPNPGASGNSLYAISAATNRDVWAVGQQNNPGSDEPLIEHYNGKRWSTMPTTPHGGTNGLLDAVTTRNGQVWAAGQTDDAAHAARPLIGHLERRRFALNPLRTIGGAYNNLNGIAIDPHGTLWASGTTFDPHGSYDGTPGGVQQTLILRRDRNGWHHVPAPSPGTADRVLGAMISVSHQLITVGYFKAPHGRQALIETHTVR